MRLWTGWGRLGRSCRQRGNRELVAVDEKTCKAGFVRVSVKDVSEPLLPPSHFVAHVHSNSILAFFHPDSEQAQFRLVLLAVP